MFKLRFARLISLFWISGVAFFIPLSATSFNLQQVASGLDRPVYVTHAGDGSGRLFVVEQVGRIRILDSTGLRSTPFLNLTSLVDSGGEKGLLGLAFHPAYATNGRFFVNYTRNEAGQLQSVIEEYQVSADPWRATPGGRTLLAFSQPFENHNGGFISFGPDGYLYIASGDGGSGGDPQGNGQRLDTLLGKILRIDTDSSLPYAIPPGNPFAGQPGARPEIWAYGLRNPWRFSFDGVTQRLFAADVGQGAWEEVDLISSGENYGWNIVEGPACFSPASNCNRSGLIAPISSYDHSEGSSVTGGYVYRGAQPTSLRGDYIFGDFVSGRIWALHEETPGNWQRTLLEDTDLAISSFGEDAVEELYVVDYRGAIFRFEFQQEPPLNLTAEHRGTFLSTTRAALTIQVTNPRGQAVNGPIVVTDQLPAGLIFERVRGAGWECTPGPTVRCVRTESLAAGATTSFSLIVLVTPEAASSLTTTVTLEDSAQNIQIMDTVEVVFLEDVPITYSQLALGGGYEVRLLVSNRSESPWQGVARLRQNNDRPWDTPWSLNGTEQGNSGEFPIDLGGRQSAAFVLTGIDTAREGYIELRPAPGSSSQDLSASFFYNFKNGATLLDSTGTPALLPAVSFLIPVEKSGAVNTGFALAPFRVTTPFPIDLVLFDQSGLERARTSFEYDGHRAQFFDELFDGLPEQFVGSLLLESEESVFLTVLRLELTQGSFQLTSIDAGAQP